MQTKIAFVTLAVNDLDRSVAFYRDGLGWPTKGIIGREFRDEVTGADGTIAFFALGGGLMLGLYERHNLAKDANVPAGSASSTEFSLGIPAESQAEVDQLLREAESGGNPDGARTHAAIRRVLGLLRRPRRSFVGDRLELQRVVPRKPILMRHGQRRTGHGSPAV